MPYKNKNQNNLQLLHGSARLHRRRDTFSNRDRTMEVWNVPFSADAGQPQESLGLVVRMSVQCLARGTAGHGRAGQGSL